MALINKKVSFSVEGLILIRSNPDGTPVSIDRILGFANTVDLSVYSLTADLTVKIDSGAEDTQTIDWTAAVDPTAVTVAEFVTAFNAAGFTDVTASQDSITGRLLIAYTGSGSPNFLQLYDSTDIGFAADLDIGQGRKYGGSGAKYIIAFDNTVGVGLPLNVKDKEEIETEAGDGTYTSIIIEALTKGLNPVITFNDDDFRIKQLVQGGTYDDIDNSYEDPITEQTNKPIFTMEVYHDIYNKGSGQPREDNAGVKRIILYSCTGNEADIELGTKTIPNYAFNLTSGEWQDETGAKRPFRRQQNLSIEDFEALDVYNL